MTDRTLNTPFAPDADGGLVPRRDVSLNWVRVPDLWGPAMRLKDDGRNVDANAVLATWHLAHDLLGALRDTDSATAPALAQFGEAVLNILANPEETDWSSDTLDAISAAAFDLGLADSSEGLFHRAHTDDVSEAGGRMPHGSGVNSEWGDI